MRLRLRYNQAQYNRVQRRGGEVADSHGEPKEMEAALRRLVTRYAQCCDRRDAAGFGALFSSEGVLEGPGFRFSTPEAIRDVPNHLTRFVKTYHTLLNFSVAGEGERASGELYSMAHHLTARADDSYDDLVMYITYHDRYVLRGDRWLFERRRVDMEFTEKRIVGNVGVMPSLE